MANTDIFNPVTGWSQALNFNPNWNYGSPRRTGVNFQTQRPRWGQWNTRSVGNSGYTFDLVFVDRPIEQVRYVRNFYEQFQRGFFTLIDYDNNGREHVGRFTSYADDTETANYKYTVRATFEDMPYVPMRNYPSDWANSSHFVYTLDDSLVQQVAISSSTGTNWNPTQTPAAVLDHASIMDPTSYEMFNLAPTAGDFAQVEYIGWGFQMTFRLGLNLGICDVYLDDMLVIQTLDLTSGSAVFSLAVQHPGISVRYTMANVPLGRHRVKVVCDQHRRRGIDRKQCLLFLHFR